MDKAMNDYEDDQATITLPDGTSFKLPVLYDAAGSQFLDIRKLQPLHSICTFDPGFGSTASCESAISHIDGRQGELLYRGYPIEELAQKGDFLDSTYLLLHGELPGLKAKKAFEREITRHTLIHETLIQFYKGFRHDADPMAILCGVVGGLSAFYPELADVKNPQQQIKACSRLIAKMPTLAAFAYKASVGQPFVYPKNSLSYAENILYMLFAVPSEEYQMNPEAAKALELILITHLDHGQNASTSTVRTAGSSQANPFACVASGVCSLWGPAHGGANLKSIQMLEEIQSMGGISAIPTIIARAKDKKDPYRLWGFGHRIYKTFDPRAKLMQTACHKVLKSLGMKKDPLLDIAVELERVALEDEYFKARFLYPNVDFYSGIILKAIGIPTSMFTVIFAVARTVGWVSQWKEMVSEPNNRIIRPTQIYVGETRRSFIPVEKRKDLADGEGGLVMYASERLSDRISRLVSTRARPAGR